MRVANFFRRKSGAVAPEPAAAVPADAAPAAGASPRGSARGRAQGSPLADALPRPSPGGSPGSSGRSRRESVYGSAHEGSDQALPTRTPSAVSLGTDGPSRRASGPPSRAESEHIPGQPELRYADPAPARQERAGPAHAVPDPVVPTQAVPDPAGASQPAAAHRSTRQRFTSLFTRSPGVSRQPSPAPGGGPQPAPERNEAAAANPRNDRGRFTGAAVTVVAGGAIERSATWQTGGRVATFDLPNKTALAAAAAAVVDGQGLTAEETAGRAEAFADRARDAAAGAQPLSLAAPMRATTGQAWARSAKNAARTVGTTFGAVRSSPPDRTELHRKAVVGLRAQAAIDKAPVHELRPAQGRLQSAKRALKRLETAESQIQQTRLTLQNALNELEAAAGPPRGVPPRAVPPRTDTGNLDTRGGLNAEALAGQLEQLAQTQARDQQIEQLRASMARVETEHGLIQTKKNAAVETLNAAKEDVRTLSAQHDAHGLNQPFLGEPMAPGLSQALGEAMTRLQREPADKQLPSSMAMDLTRGALSAVVAQSRPPAPAAAAAEAAPGAAAAASSSAAVGAAPAEPAAPVAPSACARGAEVLNALTSQPLHALIPPPGAAAAEPSDAVALAAELLHLPRGMEVLKRLAAPAPAGAPAAGGVEFDTALRVYTQAAAAKRATDPADKASHDWLDRAMSMAQAQAHGAPVSKDPRDLAAFHGVRNGFLSRAPGSRYDTAKLRLEKYQTWTGRANDFGGGVKNKSPFMWKPTRMAGRQVQRLGVMPTRTEAYTRSVETAKGLMATLRTDPASRQGRLNPTNTQAAALLDAMLQTVQRESQETIDRSAMGRMRKMAGRPLSEEAKTKEMARQAKKMTLTPELVDKALSLAKVTCPALDSRAETLRAELKASGTDVGSALHKVLSMFDADDAALQSPALQEQLGATKDAADAARISQIWKHGGELSRQDVADVMGSMAESMEPRTKLRMTQGGQVGLGITSTSIASKALSALSVAFRPDLKVTVGRDAVFEIGRPSHAAQVFIGSQTTKAARVGFALGVVTPLPGDVMSIKAELLDAKFGREKQELEGVFLRIKRDKSNEGAPRMVLKDVIHDLTMWGGDAIPATEACPNPLDHLLAKFPDLIVSQTDTYEVETRKASTAHNVSVNAAAHDLVRVGVGAARTSASAVSVQRIAEQPGVLNVQDTRSKERFGKDTRIGMPIVTVGNQIDGVSTARAGVQKIDAGLEELAQSLERIFKVTTHNNDIVPAQAQSNMEFSSFAEFEAEVLKDRDGWVAMRAAQYPGDANSPHTTERAEADLTDWLAQLKKKSALDTSFVVIQGVDHALLPELDGHRAAMQLARENGDADALRSATGSMLSILNATDSWEVQRLVAKQKVRAEGGGNIPTGPVIYGGTHAAEAQVTLSQFPPA